MSKRRTKIQKVQAAHHYSYQYQAPDISTSNNLTAPSMTPHRAISFQPLLLTPRSLIVSDLKRLVVISCLMLIFEWLIYRYT